jgi:hypothetical protein
MKPQLRYLGAMLLGVFVISDFQSQLGHASQAENWPGTWVADGNRVVCNISGSGNSLSASCRTNYPGSYNANARSSSQWSNCQVEGNKARCNFTMSYEDDHKTANVSGFVDVTLRGDTINGASTNTESSINWKPGKGPYSTNLVKGGGGPIRLERANPSPQQGGSNPDPNDRGANPKPDSSDDQSQLTATLMCNQPLELVPGREPSEICEICISGWRKNTSVPVEVLFPQQDDWWGSHAKGIVVFSGGNDNDKVISPAAVPVYDMGGRSCSGVDSKWGTYPWSFFIRARSTAPGGASTIPITVRQNPQQVDLNLIVKVTGRANRAAQNCFTDPGAGITDRNSHLSWAQGQTLETLDSNLEAKTETLFECPSMTADQLSSAFATISVIIAKYIPNANCFNGDRGVVDSNWANHKNWGAGQGTQGMLNNLEWKILSAFKCIDRSQQAAFFADVSVAIATAPSQ